MVGKKLGCLLLYLMTALMLTMVQNSHSQTPTRGERLKEARGRLRLRIRKLSGSERFFGSSSGLDSTLSSRSSSNSAFPQPDPDPSTPIQDERAIGYIIRKHLIKEVANERHELIPAAVNKFELTEDPSGLSSKDTLTMRKKIAKLEKANPTLTPHLKFLKMALTNQLHEIHISETGGVTPIDEGADEHDIRVQLIEEVGKGRHDLTPEAVNKFVCDADPSDLTSKDTSSLITKIDAIDKSKYNRNQIQYMNFLHQTLANQQSMLRSSQMSKDRETSIKGPVVNTNSEHNRYARDELFGDKCKRFRKDNMERCVREKLVGKAVKMGMWNANSATSFKNFISHGDTSKLQWYDIEMLLDKIVVMLKKIFIAPTKKSLLKRIRTHLIKQQMKVFEKSQDYLEYKLYIRRRLIFNIPMKVIPLKKEEFEPFLNVFMKKGDVTQLKGKPLDVLIRNVKKELKKDYITPPKEMYLSELLPELETRKMETTGKNYDRFKFERFNLKLGLGGLGTPSDTSLILSRTGYKSDEEPVIYKLNGWGITKSTSDASYGTVHSTEVDGSSIWGGEEIQEEQFGATGGQEQTSGGCRLVLDKWFSDYVNVPSKAHMTSVSGEVIKVNRNLKGNWDNTYDEIRKQPATDPEQEGKLHDSVDGTGIFNGIYQE